MRVLLVLGLGLSLGLVQAENGHDEPSLKDKLSTKKDEIKSLIEDMERAIARLSEGKQKNEMKADLQKLQEIEVRLATSLDICDYRTCEKEWCKKSYNCKHFTKDFCFEHRKKAADSFCQGLNLTC